MCGSGAKKSIMYLYHGHSIALGSVLYARQCCQVRAVGAGIFFGNHFATVSDMTAKEV